MFDLAADSFLIFHLHAVNLAVQPLTRNQFVVRAAIDYSTVIDHKDQIGVADRSQPLGDDKGQTAFHQVAQRLLNAVFCAGL